MKDPSASLIELLSFVIGVLGLVASAYFYFRSKEMPKPVWRTGRIPLIGSNTSLLPAAVDVRYHDVSVQSLSKTYIAFWNAGRKTIPGSDIVRGDPIRFRFAGECKVLDTRIIRRSREVNQAVLTHHDDEVQLDFDFLDPKDGIILEVVHTGIGIDVKCAGTIRGIPQGIKRVGPTRKSSKSTDAFVPLVFRSPPKLIIIAVSAMAIVAVAAAVIVFFDKSLLTPDLYDTSYKAYKTYLAQNPTSYKVYVEQIQNYRAKIARSDRLLTITIEVAALAIALVISIFIAGILRIRLPGKLSLTEKDMSDRPADDPGGR